MGKLKYNDGTEWKQIAPSKEEFDDHLAKDVSDGVHGMGAAAAEDYEVGTWTPVLEGSTAAGTHTYTSQYGSYVKIGKIVMLTGRIELSALDSGATGSGLISGFPFAPASSSPFVIYPAYLDVSFVTLDSGYSQFSGFVSSGKLSLREIGSNKNTTGIPIANFGASTKLYFSVTYRV